MPYSPEICEEGSIAASLLDKQKFEAVIVDLVRRRYFRCPVAIPAFVRARQPEDLLCQTVNISGRDLRSIVATFASVFPDGTMWLMGDGDLLLIASTGPGTLRLDDLARHWDRPGVAADGW